MKLNGKDERKGTGNENPNWENISYKDIQLKNVTETETYLSFDISWKGLILEQINPRKGIFLEGYSVQYFGEDKVNL